MTEDQARELDRELGSYFVVQMENGGTRHYLEIGDGIMLMNHVDRFGFTGKYTVTKDLFGAATSINLAKVEGMWDSTPKQRDVATEFYHKQMKVNHYWDKELRRGDFD